jgi:hypothetical protein
MVFRQVREHTELRRDLELSFINRLSELRAHEQKEGIEDGIKLPSMEIARTFAVETIDYPHPLGFQSVLLSRSLIALG